MREAVKTQPLAVCDTRLWGKTLTPTRHTPHTHKNVGSEVDDSEFYPVLAHLLDTAAAARILVDNWLPERLIHTIATKLNTTPDTAKSFIIYSAGVHDVGKITPVFQYQTFNKYTRNAFQAHQHYLETVGYEKEWDEITQTTAENVKHMVRRHEIGSGLFRSGGNLSSIMTPEGAVVAGHHGLYNIYEDYVEAGYSPHLQGYEYYSTLESTSWGTQIKAHHDAVRTVLSYSDPKLTIPTAMIPLLTSVVCLADWIASSEESIENCINSNQLNNLVFQEDTHPTEYYNRLNHYYNDRYVWLKEYALNLLSVPSKPHSFSIAFPHIAEKTTAQKILTEDATHSKGLTIVMLPMGEGKTEGALGYWLEHSEEREGVFFALPTMATADSMFDRIQNFFHTAPGTVGKLSHGRSVLNSFYDIPKKDTPVNSCDTDNCSDRQDNNKGSGLYPSDWFNGKHRALLAPIGVGTVDQLLASVLKHKYNFMRTLGIATKTIIIDEVHTFDAYQSSLLEKFLTWAHYHNVNVVLLSATLPLGKVKDYLKAYGNPSADNLQNLPYPAIINLPPTKNAEPEIVDLSMHSTGREIELHISYTENIYETVKQLTQKHPDAKIGVIVNTITSANTLSEQLQPTHSHHIILHSRMTAKMRNVNTQHAIERFGKKSTNGSDLLIATQVVECSVDLDFDILITELAPAANLIQRAGRLWRHNEPTRRQRPATVKNPELIIATPPTINNPEEEQDIYALLPYSVAEIMKTWGNEETQTGLHKGQLATLKIPSQLTALLETSEISLQDLTTARKSLENYAKEHFTKKLAAKDAEIPPPQEMTNVMKLRNYTSNTTGDPEHATRWIETLNITILPVTTSETTIEGTYNYNPHNTNLTRDKILHILDHTIPLSGSIALKVTEALDSNPQNMLPSFEHPLLKETLPVKIGYPYQISPERFITFYLTKQGFKHHYTKTSEEVTE